jgi:hypothetical protein
MNVLAAPLVAAAARNNAEWCHAFCRSHGIEGRFENGRWYSSVRTPPLYPDVVTLQPGLTTAQALAGVDLASGCSVKDSFGDLDLEGAGFAELFAAQWIARLDPEVNADSQWRSITTDAGLADWEAAWDDEPGELRFFSPRLLAEPDVVFVARYSDGQITAGGIVNRSAEVIGIGNVFAPPEDLDAAYAAAPAAAAAIWPGLPVVGYEHGPPLSAAETAGFARIGALRIWVS